MSDIRFQCRHIHVSGHRCGSPSLRGELFCYHHHTTRKPIAKPDLDLRRGHQSTFTLPEPEDRAAIQLALGEIIRRIAAGDLDPKRAGLLLYALQIASCNLPKTAAEPTETVAEITVDDLHGPIAPEAEFHRKPHQKGLEQILLEQWDRDAEEKRQRRQHGVIALQAVAADYNSRKARVAAWNPAIPCTPPPGGVLEPQRYSPFALVPYSDRVGRNKSCATVIAPPEMSPPNKFRFHACSAAGVITDRASTHSANPGANRSI